MGMLDLYPMFLVVSNTLVMYVPIKADKHGEVFSGQSPAYFYVSLGVMIAVILICLSPTNLIYKLFCLMFKDSLTNNSRNHYDKTYKERESQFSEDYSNHYPCFRVSKSQRKKS